MSTETNQTQAVDDNLQLLYRCFLGRWIDIDSVEYIDPSCYLIYFAANDITTGFQVTIEDRVTVKFF